MLGFVVSGLEEATVGDIPASIRVGGHTYEVRASAAAINQLNAHSERGRLAAADLDNLTLTVDPTRPPSLVRETVLHEVLHIAGHVTALSAQLNIASKGTDLEELAIEALDGPLLQILRDNPDLVAYLTAE